MKKAHIRLISIILIFAGLMVPFQGCLDNLPGNTPMLASGEGDGYWGNLSYRYNSALGCRDNVQTLVSTSSDTVTILIDNCADTNVTLSKKTGIFDKTVVTNSAIMVGAAVLSRVFPKNVTVAALCHRIGTNEGTEIMIGRNAMTSMYSGYLIRGQYFNNIWSREQKDYEYDVTLSPQQVLFATKDFELRVDNVYYPGSVYSYVGHLTHLDGKNPDEELKCWLYSTDPILDRNQQVNPASSELFIP